MDAVFYAEYRLQTDCESCGAEKTRGARLVYDYGPEDDDRTTMTVCHDCTRHGAPGIPGEIVDDLPLHDDARADWHARCEQVIS